MLCDAVERVVNLDTIIIITLEDVDGALLDAGPINIAVGDRRQR